MVEKRLTGSSGILTLKCKDFQTLKLEIPTADDCLNIAASMESLSNIGNSLVCRILTIWYATSVLWTNFVSVGNDNIEATTAESVPVSTLLIIM